MNVVFSEQKYSAFLLAVVVVLLLLLTGDCFAGQSDCGQVRIKMLHPLQFGHLRGSQGKKGWVYLKTDNEYFMSSSISMRSNSFPSRGQVEIIAPGGSCLDLRITPERAQGQSDELYKNICLKNVKVSGRTVPVQKLSSYIYRVEVPENTDGTDVRFLLDIGGELSLKVAKSPLDLQFVLYIECLDISK